MVLHPIACPMMLLWLSLSMVIIQEVPKKWIYTYQDVQNNFVDIAFYIKAVCCEITCPIFLKEFSSLHVFKRNYCSIIGWQISEYIWVSLSICRFTLFFNSSHISIMFLHFTEAPMYVLNHDACTLLSGFCTKVFCIICQNNISNLLLNDFYLMLICNLSTCVVWYYFRF